MPSCADCWMNGSTSWTRCSSSTCCRYCAGPSALLLRRNVKLLQNESRSARRIVIVSLPKRLISNWRCRLWLPSISYWVSVMTETGRNELQTRLWRWRLMLGEASAAELDTDLSREEQRMDGALSALYDSTEQDSAEEPRRSGGLGSSAPRVARWLGDIRSYFPTSVVQVMQRDAIDRLGLTSMLLEPELLDSVQPDVHLAATLVSLNRVMPETAKRTARLVVGRVVAEIERRIANTTRAAVRGAVSRSSRTRRPRLRDVDWNATIRRNLDHYVPERRTVIPERLVGYGHRAPAMSRDVIVAVDQSGSMAESVVYAAVFGATLASISSVRTSLVAFDVDVVDL